MLIISAIPLQLPIVSVYLSILKIYMFTVDICKGRAEINIKIIEIEIARL